MNSIVVHPEVEEALRAGRPVVALETAVLTHGLPRTPASGMVSARPAGWSDEEPLNLEASRAMQRAVRDGGAVPATVGVRDGELHVGLDDASLIRLAEDPQAAKASTANLAYVMAAGSSAGTTVSATLAACGLIEGGPIRVLATGGVGGVHAAWTNLPDISTDLRQLATTPACVVCSGAKSILDLPATMELLETLGIPVVGYRTDFFPHFHALGDEQLQTSQRADAPDEAAKICAMHWRGLEQRSGLLLANPIPPDAALERAELDAAVVRANEAADRRGIRGPERTPFLLAELARLTDGRSLSANLALLVKNARVAAAVASALPKHLDTPHH